MMLATVLASAGEPGFFASLLEKANITEPWQFALFFFGLLGQTVFFMRWVFQWIASERRGESHMPIIFWWCSLLGALMLLIYFAIRLEPIGVIGQLTGWTIYARNLYLLRKQRLAGETESADPASTDKNDVNGICAACGQPLPAT